MVTTDTTDPDCDMCLDGNHRYCYNPIETTRLLDAPHLDVHTCCCGYALRWAE